MQHCKSSIFQYVIKIKLKMYGRSITGTHSYVVKSSNNNCKQKFLKTTEIYNLEGLPL